MSDITKEELMAMIEVQSKTATAMENIASSMRSISENNKEIVASQKLLVDGCSKCQATVCEKLIAAVEKKIDDKSTGMVDTKKDILAIKGDTTFMKWVFGGVGLVVAIVVAIFKIMSWSH